MFILTHHDLSYAVVQAMCSDDQEETDKTIEQAQMVQERPCRRQVRRRSFRYAWISYGVRPRTWSGRGQQWGGVQAVRGNTGKVDAIDAHEMLHSTYPDAVSVELSQILLMAMLLPAFARKASNTYVQNLQSWNHFLMEQILLLEIEWNRILMRKRFTL